jgi:hypothetical protein
MSFLDSQKIIRHVPHWLGPAYAKVRGWAWDVEDSWRDACHRLGEWLLRR